MDLAGWLIYQAVKEKHEQENLVMALVTAMQMVLSQSQGGGYG